MIPTVVLTAAAAVFVSAALTKWKRQNREDVSVRKADVSVRKAYGCRDSLDVMANNLKAAAKKVDNSAIRVEVALKPLMAF